MENPFIARLKTALAETKTDPVAVQRFNTARAAAEEATKKFEQAKSFGFVNEHKFDDGVKRAWNNYLKAFAAAMELFETTSSADWKTSAEMQELIKAQHHYETVSMPKAQRAKIAYKNAKLAYDTAEQAGTMTATIKQAYVDAKIAYDKSTAYEKTLAEYKAAGERLDGTKIGKLEKAVRTLENLFRDWKVTCARIEALKQAQENAKVETAKKQSLEKALQAAMKDVE